MTVKSQRFGRSWYLVYHSSMHVFKKEESLVHWDGILDMNLMTLILKHQALC
jgi:hypothetical protein